MRALSSGGVVGVKQVSTQNFNNLWLQSFDLNMYFLIRSLAVLWYETEINRDTLRLKKTYIPMQSPSGFSTKKLLWKNLRNSLEFTCAVVSFQEVTSFVLTYFTWLLALLTLLLKCILLLHTLVSLCDLVRNMPYVLVAFTNACALRVFLEF